MTRVAAIVEGHGEVQSVPVLLRRLAGELTPRLPLPEIIPPLRLPRDRLLQRPEEFARHLRLAAAKCQPHGWVLVLLDADDDCPVDLASELKRRAAVLSRDLRCAVVVAKREFEAWFIAAAPSLSGQRGFTAPAPLPPDPDSIRNAKGWISQHMAGRAYDSVTDQPAFAARFDLHVARDRSRSFRKLCTDWQLLTGNAVPENPQA